MGPRAAVAPGDAYALDLSSTHLVRNLLTYVRWNVTPGEPVRDVIASANPDAWRTGLPVLLGLAGILWWFGRPAASVFRFGSVWWLAFLLPVLPLANHTYLYYLYIPWAGGAIAAAALGEALLRRLPRAWTPGLAVLALATYVAVEARSIIARERATRDHLHVDRTLRDAALLRHALPRLRSAGLPSGTAVAFVNPVPRARFDLMTGAPTKPELMASRRPYYPLEAALRRGETLRLFVPGLVYRGFADTIPSGWEDAQIFYFEQRGWLQPWGRGQQALLRQAELQAKVHRWESARITYARVRAICDTIPEAVYGQYTALRALGRDGEARALEPVLRSRWPSHRLSNSIPSAPPRGGQ